MLTRLIVLFLVSTVLQSCDCVPHVKGIVISNSTREPIEGASIVLVDQDESTLSDKNGFFEVSKHTGFCFDPQVRISKVNYKSFELTVSGSNESKSYKVTSKQDFIEYDKPFYPDINEKSTFTTGAWIDKYSQYFTVSSDTILFYLDTLDAKGEVSRIQSKLKVK